MSEMKRQLNSRDIATGGVVHEDQRNAIFQLRVVRALDLPNYHIVQAPNCFARITVDGQYPVSTITLPGSKPEWNECFDIPLTASSAITVQVIHVRPDLKEVLRGTAVILGNDVLSGDRGAIPVESKRKLHQAGMTLSWAGGFVVISLCRKPEGRSPPPPLGELSTISDPGSEEQVVPPSTLHPLNAVEVPTKDVSAAVEHARGATVELKGYNGTALDSATVVASSNLFEIVIGYVDKVVQFGDIISQVHPYAKVAWDALTAVHKILKGQQDRDDKIRGLLSTIVDMLGFMEAVDALSKIQKLQDTVSCMMKQIHACAMFIQHYGERGFLMRAMRDTASTAMDNRISLFVKEFENLKSNFALGIGVQTWRSIHNIENEIHRFGSTLEEINASEKEKVLQRLPGSHLDDVKFDESHACLDATRTQLLCGIRTWVHSVDPDEKRILWLSGCAGSGKSSVANSTAMLFDGVGCLGACFRFNRDKEGLNSPKFLFGNLCYQLVHFSKSLESKVLPVINMMGHVVGSSLQTQAKKLIVDSTNAAELVGPVVVVIDALDESGDKKMRKNALLAIAAEFPRLPRSVKVFITSRDEPDIRGSLESCSRELRIDDAVGTAEDIASYIKSRMKTIRLHSHFDSDWPGQEKLQELNRRAELLFIWASVACNFVEDSHDPAGELNRLLAVKSVVRREAHSPFAQLDRLYCSILENAFPNMHDAQDDFRYVVGTIVALRALFTQIGLDSLLGLGDGSPLVLPGGRYTHLASSNGIISSLRPILRIEFDSTGTMGLVRLLHPSLYDFLTSRADEHFRIDLLEQNGTLALRCLAVMNSQLKFNIINVCDLSLSNNEVGDLPRLIGDCISEALRYSCHFFAHHLATVRDLDTILRDALDKFIFRHLLHWIEAMSWQGKISEAEDCLQVLAGWMKESEHDTDIQAIVDDGISFLRNFGHVVRLSALHTYYSALPLTPKTTKLFQSFFHDIPCLPGITSSHHTWSTLPVRVIEGHTSSVWHVVFSPDGRKLASGSDDGTVRLWDVEKGQAIATLEGHISSVWHIMFSPDGKKLASASYDKTVRLWDVETGQAIGSVLEGHTKSVCRVVFSPDGRKLVSASRDNTVRLWNIEADQAIGSVLKGHSSRINHVAFSPDGKKLASASDDNTVRLWHVETDQATGLALEGHTYSVWHVVFSPDGKKLASASCDKTVRLWNVETDQVIGSVLQGHTSWVNHVVFSPDGNKLASASYDNTVRLWKVETGQAIGSVLEGHTKSVNHVVFFPDGKKLASGSSDSTVRLWDAETGQAIGLALEGHTSSVWHVAFSPDRRKLASASYDNTVRLWDVETSQGMGSVPEGHTKSVNHVVFSPDGKKLASGSDDNTVRLWDVETGLAIATFEGHISSVSHVAFSPNGKKVASASNDNMVRLWDVEAGIESVFKGHGSCVNHVVFSPDGKRLASGSGDNTVRLWDIKTGQAIAFEGHMDSVQHVVFSPDGKKLASKSCDNMVRFWDVETGQAIAIATAPETHPGWVRRVAFLGAEPNSLAQLNPAVATAGFQLNGADIVIDHLGFLVSCKKRLLWLPVTLRGCVDARQSAIAIGGRSGAVTFIRLSR